jgi:hypothetical protein
MSVTTCIINASVVAVAKPFSTRAPMRLPWELAVACQMVEAMVMAPKMSAVARRPKMLQNGTMMKLE